MFCCCWQYEQLIMGKHLKYIFIILAVFVADQAVKKLVAMKIALYGKVVVFDNFFWIIHIRNEGGAFGMLSELSDPVRKLIFIFIPGIALLLFVVYLFKFAQASPLGAFALSLVVGGALGNFVDRIRFGSVLDFLDVHWFDKYHWPAFNVADSAITIGACFLIIDFFLTERKKDEDDKEITDVS